MTSAPWLVVVLIATGALLAFSSTASAQVTPFQVELSSDAAAKTVSPGECADFEILIRNTGQAPIPQQHNIVIRVSAATTGWTHTVQPVSPVPIPASGESRQPLRTCAGDDAADGDRDVITITATVQDDPRDPKASDQISVTATVAEDGVLGLDVSNTVLWVALASVVGLVGLVLLTRRKASAAIVVSCPEPAKEILPGRGTSFPIRIRNEGRARDVVSLTTSPVPRGWDTFLPLVDVPLEPREEQTVWLSVKSPEDARPDDRVVVKVVARSASGGQEQASIDTLVTVRAPSAPAPTKAPPAATGGDAEASVYGPEDDEDPKPRPVAVKRRKR